MANHLHGYHGSSKDQCIYCGSGESEDSHCEARTAHEQKLQHHLNHLKKVHDEVSLRLTDEEYESIRMATLKSWTRPHKNKENNS